MPNLLTLALRPTGWRSATGSQRDVQAEACEVCDLGHGGRWGGGAPPATPVRYQPPEAAASGVWRSERGTPARELVRASLRTAVLENVHEWTRPYKFRIIFALGNC